MNTPAMQAPELSAPWISSATGIAWGTIVLFVAIIAGYGALMTAVVTESVPLPWLVLASTVLLYLLFTVAHEAGHGNIAHEVAAMKPVERMMGWIAAAPFLVMPFGLFAKIHDFHHAFTNDPQRDPDYWVSGQSFRQACVRAFGLAFKYIQLTAGAFSRHPVMVSTHKSTLVYFAITLSFVVGVIAAGHVETLIWIGVVPLFLGSFVLAMLFDWIPHTPARQQGRFQNTRVYLFPGLNVLTLGQSYHLIHHLYPRVSWYHYKRVFHAMRAELESKNSPIEVLYSAKAHGFLRAPEALKPVSHEGVHKLTLSVASIDRETPDSVVIRFENPGCPLAFKAGQYLTVTRVIEGEPLTRCYSICRSPASGELAIGVRSVTDGRVSGFLNYYLKVGDKLSVAGPFGDFVYDANDDLPLTLVAGGSGITPIMSILQTALLERSATTVHLVYANRSVVDAMFLRQLNALVLQYPERLKISHIYERGHGGWDGLTGRLDADTLISLIDRLPGSREGRFFICGPAPLKKLVVDTLQAICIQPNQISVEEFASQAPAPEGAVHQVEVILADRTHRQFDVAENQTILQAASQQGIALPYACGIGQCGCCMMRVIDGHGELISEDPPGLLPGERAQGLTLACQCKPRSAMTLSEGGIV